MALAPFSVLASRINTFFEGPPNKPTVLVLGYGWGARAFTESLDRRQYNLRVVSTSKARLNQPSLLYQLEPTYTEPPTHIFIENDEAIQLSAYKKKHVQGQRYIYPYDYLVIATGSEAHDFNIPGVKKHCLMCKTAEDITAIKAIRSKEALVLGAGPTGIELACKLQSRGMQVQLLEATNSILPGFSKEMQERVDAHLKDLAIPVIKGEPVLSITDTHIHLKTQAIPYSSDQSLLWTCGIRPGPFVRSLSGDGPLSVDANLHYAKDIYAIGDSIKGHGPPTAQNAVQQGTYLAHWFNQGRKGPGYTFNEKGKVLDLTTCMFVEVFGTVWYVPSFLTGVARSYLK
jgi:NADH dehydrogenase FAD-containing subunit